MRRPLVRWPPGAKVARSGAVLAAGTFAGAAIPAVPAGAPSTAIACHGGQAATVGTFSVACASPGSFAVTVTAAGTSCTPAATGTIAVKRRKQQRHCGVGVEVAVGGQRGGAITGEAAQPGGPNGAVRFTRTIAAGGDQGRVDGVATPAAGTGATQAQEEYRRRSGQGPGRGRRQA